MTKNALNALLYLVEMAGPDELTEEERTWLIESGTCDGCWIESPPRWSWSCDEP